MWLSKLNHFSLEPVIHFSSYMQICLETGTFSIIDSKFNEREYSKLD